MKLLDISGQKFGSLFVTKRVEGAGVSVWWECLCDCGNIITRRSQQVRHGAGHCGCKPSPLLLPEDIALWRRAVAEYRRNATSRSIEWNLDEETALTLIRQDCSYCKAPPSNISRAKDGRTILRGGIDRVDNTKGYEAGNVVPCCGDCNIAKGDKTVEQFLTWIHRVARFTSEPEFSLEEITDRDLLRNPVIEEVAALYRKDE